MPFLQTKEGHFLSSITLDIETWVFGMNKYKGKAGQGVLGSHTGQVHPGLFLSLNATLQAGWLPILLTFLPTALGSFLNMSNDSSKQKAGKHENLQKRDMWTMSGQVEGGLT